MEWARCTTGYRLEDVDGQLWIVPKNAYREKGYHEHYDPEQTTGLFRVFAQITTAEHCLAFANRYGLLFHSCPPMPLAAYYSDAPKRWPGGMHMWGREPVESWLNLANLLREALEQFDEFRRGAYDQDITLLNGWGVFLGLLNRLWFEHVSLALQLKAPPHEQGMFGEPGISEPTVELTPTPIDLYGVIFLQLARHFAGQKERRICAHCGNGFWLYADKQGQPKRSDAKFCSDRCRAAAFYKRNKERRKAAARAYYEKTKANRPAPGSEGS